MVIDQKKGLREYRIEYCTLRNCHRHLAYTYSDLPLSTISYYKIPSYGQSDRCRGFNKGAIVLKMLLLLDNALPKCATPNPEYFNNSNNGQIYGIMARILLPTIQPNQLNLKF